MSGRRGAAAGTALVIAVLVGIPAGYAHFRQKDHRNVRVVCPGVLYRSGQLPTAGLHRLVHDFGIRTVVSLRDSDDPSQPPPDLVEERFCKSMDVRHVRIPPRSWWPEY